MKKAFLFLVWLLFTYQTPAHANIADKLAVKMLFLAEYAPGEAADSGAFSAISFYSPDKPLIKITAKDDGTVLNFVRDFKASESAKKSLPQISKGMAYQTALDFLNIAADDIISEINKNIYSNTYSFAANGFNIRFNRIVNGINYPNDGVSLLVDGGTGQVSRFSRNWNENIVFEPIDEIISLSDAEECFKQNIGLQLRYGKKAYNSDFYAGSIYVPAQTNSINALNGKATTSISPVFSNRYNEMISILEKSSTSSPFDPSQVDEIYSINEMLQHIKKINALRIDDSFTVNNAKHYKNADGEYIVTLSLANEMHRSSVTINAKTLDILGFSNDYSDNKTDNASFNAENAKQISARFLDKHKQSFISELSSPQVTQLQNTATQYNVLFERTINNIPYKSNYISFDINSNDEIISMASMWDNIQFDNLSDVLSPSEAYDIFFKTIGLRLIYLSQGQNRAVPAYIVNPQTPAIIDAKTGNILTYDGSMASAQKGLDYIGLDGHYAIVPIKVLADCDIYISQGNVVLDDFIQQKDFMLLLAAVSPETLTIPEKQTALTNEELSMVYAEFMSTGVIERESVNPNGYLTRAEAVKYLIRIAGYKEVAELYGIYKMPFMDAHKIPPELYGYVGLARGMGLISGSGGYFHPSQNLTNADALILIYNYLKN
ncbi:MAG: hypothetical protein M0R40_11345 [Firmicutes bacterium]|nr:hypothetical protein [Bacillota bacterium]